LQDTISGFENQGYKSVLLYNGTQDSGTPQWHGHNPTTRWSFELAVEMRGLQWVFWSLGVRHGIY